MHVRILFLYLPYLCMYMTYSLSHTCVCRCALNHPAYYSMCVYVCVCIRTYMHTYIHTYIYIYIYIHTHTHTYTQTHSHSHTQIHARTHTHRWALNHPTDMHVVPPSWVEQCLRLGFQFGENLSDPCQVLGREYIFFRVCAYMYHASIISMYVFMCVYVCTYILAQSPEDECDL